jgi:cyclase
MRYRDRPPMSLLCTMTLVLCSLPSPASAQERAVTKLADGVYEIQHGAQSGNTTVMIGDRQVFVVDAGFLQSDAQADIAQIRKWTDKPVAFVLNTHFHNDHNLGNRAYMTAFPAVTIIAHVETRKDMDMFGPGSEAREKRSQARLEQMLKTGNDGRGNPLGPDGVAQVKEAMARQQKTLDDMKDIPFQSATLTFDHDFTIDLGNREVQVKFLGRGNTPGDAVAWLPKEQIVAACDLVVYPMPYFYDGYPSEWIQTLQNLAQLDATTIVPGHGPIMHDKAYLYLVRDFMKSAVEQVNAALRKTGPAMFRTVDDIKGSVDLSSFRQRFAGTDASLGGEFDVTAADLVRVVFREASSR